MIDILGALAEGRKFIKPGIDRRIECNVAVDALVEPTLEMHAGPFHVSVSTDLRENSFKLGVIFKDRADTLVHEFNGELEVMDIIGMCEACLKACDELVKGGELSGRCIFGHKLALGHVSKEGRCHLDLLQFIDGGSDI